MLTPGEIMASLDQQRLLVSVCLALEFHLLGACLPSSRPLTHDTNLFKGLHRFQEADSDCAHNCHEHAGGPTAPRCDRDGLYAEPTLPHQ